MIRDTEVQPLVVITAAGDADHSFTEAGLTAPKNLVQIGGKALLQRSLEGFAESFSNVSVAIRSNELQQFGTGLFIQDWNPVIRIIPTNPGNKGALVTALCALEGSNLDLPLIISAGDSALQCDLREMFETFLDSNYSAATVTFRAQGSRWSYVALDSRGDVEEVQEKRQISDLATTGTFFFRRAVDFVRAAEWCLVNQAMTNGQFFTSTALNYIVSLGLRVTHVEIPATVYVSYSTPLDVKVAIDGKK